MRRGKRNKKDSSLDETQYIPREEQNRGTHFPDEADYMNENVQDYEEDGSQNQADDAQYDDDTAYAPTQSSPNQPDDSSYHYPYENETDDAPKEYVHTGHTADPAKGNKPMFIIGIVAAVVVAVLLILAVGRSCSTSGGTTSSSVSSASSAESVQSKTFWQQWTGKSSSANHTGNTSGDTNHAAPTESRTNPQTTAPQSNAPATNQQGTTSAQKQKSAESAPASQSPQSQSPAANEQQTSQPETSTPQNNAGTTSVPAKTESNGA